MWDISEAKRIDELMDEFLTLTFGKAEKPMREFYKVLREEKRQTADHLTGTMYRLLAKALSLEADSKIQKRIHHLILYTRYVELYYDFKNEVQPDMRLIYEEELYRFLWQIRKTSMVHAYGIWSRKFKTTGAISPHNWKSDKEFTSSEILEILNSGIKNNPLNKIQVTKKSYSKELIPVDKLNLAKETDGRYPPEAQSHQAYKLWLKQKGTLHLKVNCKRVWNNHPHSIKLTHYGKTLAESKNVKPDAKDYHIFLKSNLTLI